MPRKPKRKTLLKGDHPRKILGITQSDFSGFFGISPSLLSMIELRKRTWPDSSNHLRSTFFKAFYSNETEPLPVPELGVLQDWEIVEFRKEVKKLHAEILNLGILLEDMIFDADQALRLHQVTRRLESEFPDPQSHPSVFISLWKHKSAVVYRKTGPVQQELVRLRIEALQKRKAYLEGLFPKENPELPDSPSA